VIGWPLPHRCGDRAIHSPLVPRNKFADLAHVLGYTPVDCDGGRNVEVGMDDDERQALRAEGLDPADPAVAAAISMVRWSCRFTARTSRPYWIRATGSVSALNCRRLPAVIIDTRGRSLSPHACIPLQS